MYENFLSTKYCSINFRDISAFLVSKRGLREKLVYLLKINLTLYFCNIKSLSEVCCWGWRKC